MSSYAIMNDNWMILSWVMLHSEGDQCLEPMYEGLAHRYSSAGIEKAKYQWVDRDCCAAFRVPDSKPREHLLWDSWRTTDAVVAEVTSGNLANTCASRSKFNNDIVVKLDLFHCMRRFTRECVSEHHPLYRSFCKFLSAAFTVVDQSDLEKLKEAYTFCKIAPAIPTKQHIREHCRTKVPHPRELVQRVEQVFHHFYLAKDPNDVLLFKPSMLKVWRIQRVHILRGCLSDPEVEDGILYRYGGTLQLNHTKGEGAAVPIWIPVRGTSQQEGFHFHQARWAQGLTGVVRWNFQRLVDLKQPDVVLPAVFDPVLIMDLNVASVKVTGQSKYPVLHVSNRDTGERFGLQYLEPVCRPVPLNWDKHKSQKIVPPVTPVAPETEQQSCQQSPVQAVVFNFPAAPVVSSEALEGETSEEKMEMDELASLFAETHPAPPAKAPASRDSSPQAALMGTETQQLWQSLTAEAVSVPVTTLPPAVVNPPAVNPSVNQAEIERVVREVLENTAQQQQQQQQKKKLTRTCLACGQPKSRYLGDGSSIHFFHQAGEGMTDTMTWRDFQQSKHYGAEKQRWTEEKGGRG
ncbi:unnamed protein product [Merluccius merluccius]